MKKIDEKKSINKELRRNKKELANWRWIIRITLIAFTISVTFSLISQTVIPNVNIFVGLIVLAVFILIGVLFDIIGVAVQVADEKPFHSMNSRKIKGAKMAVLFKKNAEKVSSFCNDVVGDICGIISGTTGAILAITLSSSLHIDPFITALFVTGLISGITIGGKAIGKSFAVNKSNYILYEFATIASKFYKIK